MALLKWQPPALRRVVDDEGDVSWLELFFDLIYVAALIQLGDALSDDVSWGGVGRFAALFVILWWTWTGTTAFMNRFAVDDVVHRLLVFAQMFAVGNMALVAVAPIDDRWSWFVVAYVGARFPLLMMYYRARSLSAASRRLGDLYLGAFTIGIAMWTLSLAVPSPARFVVWGAALAVEFAAPVIGVRRAEPPPTHSGHFRERYALFTIIVLGESFVKTLTELAGIGITPRTQVFGALGFVIIASLWWTYFDDIAQSGIRPAVGSIRDGASIRVVWVYAHLPLAMGLTAYGVASKKLVGVDDFDDALRVSYLWLLAGAVALVLSAAAVVDAVTTSPHFAVGARLRIAVRLGGATLVLLVAAALTDAPAPVTIGLIALVTALQIAIEVVYASRAERSMRESVSVDLERRAGTCVHLEALDADDVDVEAESCGECERLGMPWVQLRVCLTCGIVGCCDDSGGRHARIHHVESGHRVMATGEADQTWAYCFADDVVDDGWTNRAAAAEPSS